MKKESLLVLINAMEIMCRTCEESGGKLRISRHRVVEEPADKLSNNSGMTVEVERKSTI
jgi:hypothetical protein